MTVQAQHGRHQKTDKHKAHHGHHAKSHHSQMPVTTRSPKALELYYQGMAKLDQSRPVAARPFFDQALELDPGFIMAMHRRRATAGTFKEGQAMRAEMDEAMKTAKLSEAETIYFGSFDKARKGDMPGYLADIEKLMEMYPHDHRLLMQYAGYFNNRDKPKALKLYAKVAELAPNFTPVYNILGYAYKDSGDKKKAEEAFKKAIELDPSSPNGYDSYGELLLSMGRFKDSIKAYDQALEVEPLFPSAQIGVASNLCLMGDYHAARARLSKLFEIAPHDGIRSGIHWALSVTYADQGDYKGALTELDKNFAISHKNGDTTAMRVDLFNKATILLAAGRNDDAAAACKQAIELVRNDEKQPPRSKAFNEAFYTLWEGRLAAENNDLHKASEKMEAFFEAVEALNANNFKKSGFDLRGLIQLKSEQYAEALESFKQGNIHDPYVMYYKGLAYQGLGNKDQANRMFDHVMNANSPLNYHFSIARRLAKASKTGHSGS